MNENARNKNNDDDDGRPQLVAVPLPYKMFQSVRHQQITDFYLSEPIGAPADYASMIHHIASASAADIVYIHLNTPGGRLDTGIQLINAMKESQARIVAVLDSKAYSLGTMIFLAADEFIVHENCTFMIHNYSSATFGKGNEQKAEMQATERWFEKLANKYYFPFLSKEEISKVLNGQDIWMDSDEVKKRLKNMVRIQQEEIDAANAPKPTRTRRKTDTPAKGVTTGELPPQDVVPVKEDGEVAPVRARRTRKTAPVPAAQDVAVNTIVGVKRKTRSS